MGNGIPKGLHGLARDPPVAPGLNERDRGENGHHFFIRCQRRAAGQGTETAFFKNLLNRKERRPGVQGVKNGFDQENVGPAIQQAANLFAVGGHQFIVGAAAGAGVVDIGGDGRGFGGRPDGPGDNAHPARLRLFDGVRRPPGAFRPGLGQFIRQRLHPVIRQRNGLCVEGVGLNDVRARFQILAVDFLDHRRFGDIQQIIQPLQIPGPVGKTGATVIRLGQLVTLDHRPHRPVNDDDPFAQQALQFKGPVQFHDACLVFSDDPET